MSTVATAGHMAHEDAHQPTSGKVGIWIFLASEIMFFAGLIGSYIVLRVANPDVFTEGHHHLNIKMAAVNTIILICSSLTMALAVKAAQHGNSAGVRNFLLLTAALGTAFCAVKYFEYTAKFDHHIYPSTSIFFSCYFTMTGVHVVHVIGGILPMFFMGLLAGGGRFCKPGNTTVELVGLYWHFVDVVWIFLFPMLYLIR